NFFSPLTWIQQTGTNPPRGDLYELRHGFPTAQMILSTTKPQGEVVLNENPQTGGIHVHHFEAYSSHDFEITGTTSGDIALTTPYTA
ncbi:hypothetical protein ACSLVQ_29205, partial [Klebsiella pneumoniae]|uniref:hypothetical protein n=1 Tax=Klebsiella pneumoniae TaxID=573 RepID=UPI003EDEF1D0